MSEQMAGGCQCGRVRYVAEVEGDDAYLCHCRMCQRATGGVAAAFKQVLRDAVTWTCAPDRYASSPIARRGFCSACGTPLTFEYVEQPSDGRPAKIDLTLGSFDDPSRFHPTSHFGWESHLEPWLDTAALPRLRSDEYQPLVAKWEQARDA